MKRKLILLFNVLIISSCGSQSSGNDPDAMAREASEAPKSFYAAFENLAGNTPCQSHLTDPEDDTELILVSSVDGVGNYQVPLGKYGLASDELLRIDCRSGEVIGVVKKR